MNANLLHTFLSEECDAYVRSKLLDAIREQRISSATVVREYTFNRFNVTLDFGTKEAALHDDLTVGPEGEYKLRLEDFEKALQESQGG